MTSVLNVDTIAAKNGTSPVTLTKQSAAQHFLRYNHGTTTINISLNTSSVTDNGTGDYTINFANSFASSTDICGVGSTDMYDAIAEIEIVNANNCRWLTRSVDTAPVDASICNTHHIGDLA